jgi:hypothetical protein
MNMKVTQNEKGQDVYELSHITDIALLPEHMVDHALEALPLLIRSIRLILISAKAEGKYEKVVSTMPKSIRLVDDNEIAVRLTNGGDPLMSVRIVSPLD